MMSRFTARLRGMVGRAVVSVVNDALRMQGVQVQPLANNVREAERFQNYGLTSVPHTGAEALVLSVGGSSDHAVVVCVDDRRYRLTGLDDGEVALYDDLGQCVHLTRTGMVIKGAGLPITITDAPQVSMDVPLVTFAGDANVAGTLTAKTVTAETVSGTTNVVIAGKSGKDHYHKVGTTNSTPPLV